MCPLLYSGSFPPPIQRYGVLRLSSAFSTEGSPVERRNLLFGFKVRLLGQVMAGVAVALLWSLPAAAQLSRVTSSMGEIEPGAVMRGTDTAYDPANGVFLLVTGNGPVFGMFVDGLGQQLTGTFTIWDGLGGHAHFPRAEYSPHAGGFLVTWHHAVGHLNYVFGRMVTYPAGPVSAVRQISGAEEAGSWWETGPAMAYSNTSRRFLVAWRTIQYGVLGSFVDINGVPFGGILTLEPAGGSRDPALAWNAATDEFGLATTGFVGNSAFAAFRRIRASDGGVSNRTSFGFSAGTFATGIDVNPYGHSYVMAWAVHPGTRTATFDLNGNQIATNFVTDRFGYDQSLDLAFNSISGTFLAVSSDSATLEVGGVEVAYNGAPSSAAQVITNGARLGSFHPMAKERFGTNQWSVVYSRDFRGATKQVVATSSTAGGTPIAGGGGSAPSPTGGGGSTGCSTPDPFVAIGGGTCVNGGWVPGGTSAPPPTSPPPPSPSPASTCTAPDPFAAIGGGTCVNGGWVPGSSGGGATNPGGCTTPDPFAAIGGGVCVSGGWRPGGGGSSGGSGGCTTPDPFVAIGGGTCVNGGWTPGGSGGSGGGNTGGCTTPDPFASLGGGSCVSGGWVPRGLSCTTPDPFASLGGGTCQNGGWVPGAGGGGGSTTASTGCAGPDPFTSIGGGSCVSGGWVPGPAAAGGCTTPDPFVSLGGGVCVSGGWVPRGAP
jgi:hypothetical protein